MENKLPTPGQPIKKTDDQPDITSAVNSIANCIVWVTFIGCITYIAVRLIGIYHC